MLKPAAKPKPKKADEVERPDVELHDEVYFRHASGPKCGRVIAHGKHGATVHADGEPHKVRWENVLGHKVKVRPNVRVVDEGVDGMIVEDPAGRRRYVHDPVGDEPPPMTKSLAPRIVFFGRAEELLKAAGGGRSIKNRPGLSQKDVTDKRGRTAKHWVRTGKPAPKERKAVAAKPEAAAGGQTKFRDGDPVDFQIGGAKGAGVIASEPGADGAHVRDDTGHVHTLTWDQMRPRPKSGGGPGDGGESDDPDQIARTLFNTSDLEKLPAKVDQPVYSWDDLLAKGKQGLGEYTKMLDQVASSLHLVTGKRPQSLDDAQMAENEKAKEEGREPVNLSAEDYMLPEHWEDPHGYLFIGPLKGKDRAAEKVKADYDGDWSQLRDMVRATIAVPSITQVPKVMKELAAAGITPAQKPKNNMVKPLPGGYRDVNMIVRLPNGMLAEMQVHVKPMTLAKEKGHKLYEHARTIKAKYTKGGSAQDKSEWEPGDRREYDDSNAKQEKLYGEAWRSATDPKKEP